MKSLDSSGSQLGDFTIQAQAYARARPGYPLDLVDRLLKYAKVVKGDAVADIGAGTGLFTQCLSGRGLGITAIEPNESMAALAEPMADVTWRTGTFEQTGLAGQSQRWMVAAQAFHWADAKRALPEIRRVLEPGGFFTVLWNNRENEKSEVLTYTQALFAKLGANFDAEYRSKVDVAGLLVSTGDFARVHKHEAHHVVTMSAQRFLELWHSHNRLLDAVGPEGVSCIVEDLRGYLRERKLDAVEVPYVTDAWTAQ